MSNIRTTDARLIEIVEYCLENGDEKAAEDFKLTHETLNRYKRLYKERFGAKDFEFKKILKQIGEQYSEDELKSIAKSGRLLPKRLFAPSIDFDGDRIRFGFMTDTHFGSSFFKESLYDSALREIEKADCEFICHAGDVTEGMSNRAGHIYELSHLGYDRQKEYAIEQLSKWDKQWFLIDGNHDRWFTKSNGAMIVSDIAQALPKADFLGHDSGNILLKGNVVLAMRHGEDGSSYALSYRMQKFIEAISGGHKPNILLFGHSHKALYLPERNIHAIDGGSIQLQTDWMQSKRMAAHTGFWIIDVWVKDGGVTKFCPCWHPFYV